MAYRITDAHCDPAAMTESLHTEELVRLPDCFICYQPPQNSPNVSPVPSAATGRITFGSFNAMPKISERVIELWARILRQIPHSRLVLKNRSLHDPDNQRSLREMFACRGIAEDRLVLLSTVASLSAHLERYSEIDVALDPFPYHGTTTTCEALWMGVPVVTLAGNTHRSRVGVSLLSNVGLQDLIANTPQQYEQLAIELARDIPRLTRIRSELRARMRGSPLTDSERFIRNLEAQYARMISAKRSDEGMRTIS
jgi:predicted O-linked N-acetylglucosamine transferase (SPINDLY family)